MPRIPLWVNSNPASGSQNLNSSGNQFQTAFTPPIIFPPKCKNPRIAVVSADVWWTVINVSAANNNNQFVFTNDAAVPSKVVLTLPNGLYGIADLNSMIDTLAVQAGYPSGLFTISGIPATQHSIITITQAGYQINGTAAGTVTAAAPGLLGFNSEKLPSGGLTTASQTFTSESVANFSSIQSFQIQSTSFGGGLTFNGQPSNALCNIPINVAPGQLISIEYTSLLWCALDKLRGATIANSIWTLTDQNGGQVNTNGEFWQVRLMLEWDDDVGDVNQQMLVALQKLDNTFNSAMGAMTNQLVSLLSQLTSMMAPMTNKVQTVFDAVSRRAARR